MNVKEELEKAYDLGVKHGSDSNINNLVSLIEQWGEPKGLTNKRPMLKSWPQFEKVQEEVTEIARAIVNNDRVELMDAIGDTFVTLVLLAKQNELDIQECISFAYDEIKDRTGRTENGKFIKDK